MTWRGQHASSAWVNDVGNPIMHMSYYRQHELPAARDRSPQTIHIHNGQSAYCSSEKSTQASNHQSQRVSPQTHSVALGMSAGGPAGSRYLVSARSFEFYRTHAMCTLSHPPTHMNRPAAGQGGSVMDSPEHVCVVANALRQGTWLTTAPEGDRRRRRARAAKRSQHQTSFRKERNGTRRAVILRLSASITVTFQIIFMLRFILLNQSWIVIISYGLRGLSESVLQSGSVSPLMIEAG